MKPVLFAHLPILTTMQPSSAVPVKCDWCPPATNNVALVLDLPGIQGVFVALALAERGYRPVPLYNSLPAPVSAEAAVDVDPMLSALQHQASRLLELRVPAAAPPAFMLDSNRQGHSEGPAQPFDVPKPSWYRSMFQRALIKLGLRQAHLGSFGSFVPDSGSAG